jgi:hypothetical protein
MSRPVAVDDRVRVSGQTGFAGELGDLQQVARLPDQELHLVLDNHAAHKHPEMKKWLAAPPRDLPLHPYPRLRFGDPRVMAVLGALCVGLDALGFTSRSLRSQVNHLFGVSPATTRSAR